MSTFVLIHGAFHGSWCWHKVTDLLQDQGHTVIAPALGIDKTSLHSVSFKAYADRVCETLDACGEAVHLVGHSMGGIARTQAAETMPHKVKSLVYLTAFLLPKWAKLDRRGAGRHCGRATPQPHFGTGQILGNR